MALTRKEIHARYEAKRPPRSEAYKAWKRSYRKANWKRNLINQARYRAKQKGLEFNVTIEDIKFPIFCPYLGLELKPNDGIGPTYNSPTLDRIDNTKGYVVGNVEVISYRANAMKSDLKSGELLRFAWAVLRRFK